MGWSKFEYNNNNNNNNLFLIKRIIHKCLNAFYKKIDKRHIDKKDKKKEKY